MDKIAIPFRWYLKVIRSTANIFSFSGAPTFHLLFTSVGLTAAFAFGYVKGTITNFDPRIGYPLLLGLVMAILMHAVSFGMGRFLGIPSFIPFLDKINRLFDGEQMKTGLPVTEYKLLLERLIRLPMISVFYSPVDVLLVLTPVLIADVLYLHTGHLLQYCIAAAIALPIHAQFCYITTDLHLSSYRSEVKRQIHEQGHKPPLRYSFSLLVKFLMVFIIIIIAAFILITLMRSDVMNTPGGFFYAISFSLYSLALLVLLTMMYFSAIFIAIHELQTAAINLKDASEVSLFSSATDRELAILADGFYSASAKVINYQKDLENQVNSATKHLQEAIEKIKEKDKEIQMELDFAADIQKGIVPADLSPWNGISFAATYLPMGKVSGDYYDIFKSENAVFVLLADVSGHGVPAAFITMAAKQSFSMAIERTSEPAAIFRYVNEEMLKRVHTQDYLTAFLLKIDEQNKVTFANASHQKAIHLVATTDEVKMYDTDGLFIGAMPEASGTYKNGETQLKSGDRVILFTDGINEHKNTQGEEFGMERFLELLTSNKDKPIQEVQNIVIQELKKFMNGAPVRDDISMVTLELHPQWGNFVEIFNQGVEAMKNREYEQAEATLLQARSILSTYPRLDYMLARLYFIQERMPEAKKILVPYCQKMIQDTKAMQMLAAIALADGDLKMAESTLRELKTLDPHARNFQRLAQTFEDATGKSV